LDPAVTSAIITSGASLASAAVSGLISFRVGQRCGGSRESSSASGPAPRPVSTIPLDQEVDVPPDIRPTVAFSKDMDPATISPNTFKLLDMSEVAQVLPWGTNGVDYDVDARRATFTQTIPWYTVGSTSLPSPPGLGIRTATGWKRTIPGISGS
jgi:hypothetical protein